MKKSLAIVLIFLTGAFMFGDGGTPKFAHRETVDREGTRSEARHGWLSIDGKTVPDFFWTVAGAGQRFAFRQRKNLWGEDGYFPLHVPLDVGSAGEALSPADRKDGFYKGDKKKTGTPAHWLYLEWTGGAGFCAADKLTDLIEVFVLAPIPRSVTEIEDLMKD